MAERTSWPLRDAIIDQGSTGTPSGIEWNQQGCHGALTARVYGGHGALTGQTPYTISLITQCPVRRRPAVSSRVVRLRRRLQPASGRGAARRRVTPPPV